MTCFHSPTKKHLHTSTAEVMDEFRRKTYPSPKKASPLSNGDFNHGRTDMWYTIAAPWRHFCDLKNVGENDSLIVVFRLFYWLYLLLLSFAIMLMTWNNGHFLPKCRHTNAVLRCQQEEKRHYSSLVIDVMLLCIYFCQFISLSLHFQLYFLNQCKEIFSTRL